MKNKKKFIIVVDDNLVDLRVAANTLEEEYAVATAPSANKLFAILENSRPDLILLDVEMPEMNGCEAIKTIKGKPETRDIPVIFLTGKSGTDCERECLSLGAVDYISKPVQPQSLLKRIETHFSSEKRRHV